MAHSTFLESHNVGYFDFNGSSKCKYCLMARLRLFKSVCRRREIIFIWVFKGKCQWVSRLTNIKAFQQTIMLVPLYQYFTPFFKLSNKIIYYLCTYYLRTGHVGVYLYGKREINHNALPMCIVPLNTYSICLMSAFPPKKLILSSECVKRLI